MADVSLVSLLLRLVVSMGVVVGLMLVAAKVLRRSAATMRSGDGRGKGKPGKARRVVKTPINVSAMQPLARGAHVAVVRAGGRELVLGVTEHQVTLLHSAIEPRDELLDETIDIDGAGIAPEMPETTSGRPAWTEALEMLRERTVRR